MTEMVLTALLLSVRIALTAMIVSLPLAIAVAYLLSTIRQPWQSVLNALVHLPLVMPPVVTGYVLLLAFGRTGPIGSLLMDWFSISVTFRWTGAAIAAGVMAFPLMVRPIRQSFEAVDLKLILAARTLGVGRGKRLLFVALPLATPGIVAGVILGFAKAMGEFGATITFVSNIPGQTQTLGLAVHTALQVPGGERAALALAGFSALISFVAILASDWIALGLQRRFGVSQ